MKEFDLLENFKEQTDRVDNEILILIKRRIQISKKIASFRLKNHLEGNPNREQEIINRIVSKSVTMDLNSNFIVCLFEEILKETKEIQTKILK